MYTCKWILALAAVAVWAAPARPADDDNIIAQEDAVQVMLLRQKSVQEDLKVTDAEARKIDEFATQQWKKVRAMRDLSEAERNQRFEAMARENEKFIHDTLTPEQRKRLNQITMQLTGLLWAPRPHVASELRLTDEQKRKIKELHKEAHKEAMEAIRSASGGEVPREKWREMRMANRRRLMSVLTDEQKAKWKEMAGEPFRGELHFGPSK
jgi:Spy/CpxP family protein refolding chaperone